MSHIIQSTSGVSWDVFLTVLDGDPNNAADNQFLGSPRTLAGAATLLLEALDKQAREALAEESAHIEKLESAYVLSQVLHLSAHIKRGRVGVRNRIEHKEEERDEALLSSFGRKGGRA